MRNLINPLFKEAGYAPDILFESASNHTLRSIVKRRLGCTILPAAYAGPDPDIAYFYLPSPPFLGAGRRVQEGNLPDEGRRRFHQAGQGLLDFPPIPDRRAVTDTALLLYALYDCLYALGFSIFSCPAPETRYRNRLMKSRYSSRAAKMDALAAISGFPA